VLKGTYGCLTIVSMVVDISTTRSESLVVIYVMKRVLLVIIDQRLQGCWYW